jgi:hypothetical protein
MEPEQILDVPTDARRTFQVLLDGGVAIIPASVGYGVVGS